MYNSYFPGQPTYTQPYGQFNTSQIPRQEVIKVNGENGARAYQIAANSSALLLDESGLMVWLVVTDGAGYKSVMPYDITPHQASQAPDYSGLETRISRLEELVNVYTSNSSTAEPRNDKQHPDGSKQYRSNQERDKHN